MFHYFGSVVGALSVVLVADGSRVVGRCYGAVVEGYWRVEVALVVVHNCYSYIDDYFLHCCCCSFEVLSYLMMMLTVVENVHLAVDEGVAVVHSYRNAVVVAMVAGALDLDIGMSHRVAGSCCILENCLGVQEVEGAVYNSRRNVEEGVNIDFVLHPSVDEEGTAVVHRSVVVVVGYEGFGCSLVVVFDVVAVVVVVDN